MNFAFEMGGKSDYSEGSVLVDCGRVVEQVHW